MEPLDINSIFASPSIPDTVRNPIQCSEEVRGTYQDWCVKMKQDQVWIGWGREQIWKESKEKYQHNINELMLKFIALRTMEAFEQAFAEVKKKSKIDEKFSTFYPIFNEITDHYVTNAVDSVMKRLIKKDSLSYESILNIRLSFDFETLRLEVEDNGTGISFDVEKQIFVNQVTTKEKEQGPHYGGVGVGLLNVSKYKTDLEGKRGFTNKGTDQGAIFWFEASLKKCEELLAKPSYQKHLNRQYDECIIS